VLRTSWNDDDLAGPTNPYVYLSDAGHFDNLGVYEMIVRRCRYIVVSDAGYDPAAFYEDLAMTVRRAHDDLGVPIHFDIPAADSDTAISRIEYSRAAIGRIAIGRIEYSRVDGPGTADGVLIYIKPSVLGDEPQQVVEYAKGALCFHIIAQGTNPTTCGVSKPIGRSASIP
jgi:hypothetical protein